MTALHPKSCCCYDCTPGFPASPGRVYQDSATLMPRLPRMVSRLHALDRHTRYRARKRLARELART
jgi:hypothetical protein